MGKIHGNSCRFSRKKNQPLLDLQHVLLTGTVAPGHVQGLENNVGAPNGGEHAKVHLPR
jgi:hypothetical protein